MGKISLFQSLSQSPSQDSAKAQAADTSAANLPIIALENGGGVRDITQREVSTVLPFGNILSMKEITPNILYQILENGVSKIAGQDPTTGKITGADGPRAYPAFIPHTFCRTKNLLGHNPINL